MKETAIEWIYKALLLDEENQKYNEWVFAKAKEMEKEQIRKAFLVDAYHSQYGFEQYYNETFKSE